MHIRCAECYAVSRVWSFRQRSVVCGSCGRKYTVRVEHPEKLTLEGVSRFAKSQGIDVALAGSVLLGIVSVEQAREIRDGKQRSAQESISRSLDRALRFKDEPEPVEAQAQPSVDVEYDPDFAEAVYRGQLTAWGAKQRGNREALIKRLSDRYRLPRRMASMVADNQVNLRTALAAASAAKSARARRGAFIPSRQTWLTAALAIALVLAVAWGVASRRASLELASEAPTFDPPETAHQSAPAIEARLVASTEFQKNEAGELVEIIGPDPWSVLRVYCAEGAPQFKREALEIAPWMPTVASVRLGIYRDLDSPESPLAISIRRDHRSGRWTVGDGRGPIRGSAAPTSSTGESAGAGRPRS